GAWKKKTTGGHLDGNHLHPPTGGCGKKIVSLRARRAFRRPVTSREVEQLAGLVSLAQKHGDSFEEGICLSIEAMLVSPHFLFRIEKDLQDVSAEGGHPIGDYELPSRLSYFLWSGRPDE